MTVYTDARSKPGNKLDGGSDERELFLVNASEMVLEAYDEAFDFKGLTFTKTITQGKSETFPIIGRKRDASDHVPGEIILGGGIEHNEVEITVDNMVVDSAFIADIDAMLNHFELVRPYSRQLGESLASVRNTRIGATLVIASRETTAPYTDGPLPSYAYDAAMKTDASKLEDAAFEGIQHIRDNDIGGGGSVFWLPHQQHLLLARYTGIDTEATSGSGNRSLGTVGPVAGLDIRGTNSVPNTNVTTGLAKYQGNFTTTVGIIAGQMAAATLDVKGMTVRVVDQPDRLGTLLIASQLSGHGQLRPESAFEVATAVRS